MGVKEGRIVVAEMGQGMSKAMTEAIEGTNISAKQMQEWGKAVANGGAEGTKAYQEVAQEIANMTDKSKQNEVGVAVFGR